MQARAVTIFLMIPLCSAQQCDGDSDCRQATTITSGTGAREVPLVAHSRNLFDSSDRLLPGTQGQLLGEFNDRALYLAMDYCRLPPTPCLAQFDPSPAAHITEIRAPFGAPWQDIGVPAGAPTGSNRRTGAVVRPPKANATCLVEVRLPPPRRRRPTTVHNPAPTAPVEVNPCRHPAFPPWPARTVVHSQLIDAAAPNWNELVRTYNSETVQEQGDVAFQAWLAAAQAECDRVNGPGKCIAYANAAPVWVMTTKNGDTPMTAGKTALKTELQTEVRAMYRPR